MMVDVGNGPTTIFQAAEPPAGLGAFLSALHFRRAQGILEAPKRAALGSGPG